MKNVLGKVIVGLVLATSISCPLAQAQPSTEITTDTNLGRPYVEPSGPRRTGRAGTQFRIEPDVNVPVSQERAQACASTGASLQSLMPQEAGTAGYTLSSRPDFWFHNPYNPRHIEAGRFILTDADGTVVYETALALPSQPGVFRVQLPESVPELESGQTYHWRMMVTCNPSNPVTAIAQSPASSPTDPALDWTDGTITYVNRPDLKAAIAARSLPDAVAFASEYELWNDIPSLILADTLQSSDLAEQPVNESSMAASASASSSGSSPVSSPTFGTLLSTLPASEQQQRVDTLNTFGDRVGMATLATIPFVGTAQAIAIPPEEHASPPSQRRTQ